MPFKYLCGANWGLGGLQVLPLYLSRQAYVRAKVNSLLLDDAGVALMPKEAAATAAHYYHQAWQYTKTTTRTANLMSGLSGSGKSTVARQYNWKRFIRSDAVRKHLGGITLQERVERPLQPR